MRKLKSMNDRLNQSFAKRHKQRRVFPSLSGLPIQHMQMGEFGQIYTPFSINETSWALTEKIESSFSRPLALQRTARQSLETCPIAFCPFTFCRELCAQYFNGSHSPVLTTPGRWVRVCVSVSFSHKQGFQFSRGRKISQEREAYKHSAVFVAFGG